MKCRLCREERPLKRSHIIPEFIYASMYDEKHRFHELSTSRSKKNKMVQKGLREELLCGNCEQKLSKYERYSSLILNGGIPITYRSNGRVINAEGFDYTKFKLFALSILWRASISKLDIFRQVFLGPHEDILRELIFNENPGKEHEYPFVLCPIIYDGLVQEDLIMQPERTKLGGCNAYRFVFGGIVWIFLVSRHRAPEVIISASISETGAIKLHPQKLGELKFIVNLAQDLYRKGKV